MSNALISSVPAMTARESHSFLDPRYLNVSKTQMSNPLLSHIKEVKYVVSEMVPDFVMGPTRCAFFLEMKFALMHPEYLQRRIDELRGDFDLRVILLEVSPEVRHREKMRDGGRETERERERERERRTSLNVTASNLVAGRDDAQGGLDEAKYCGHKEQLHPDRV